MRIKGGWILALLLSAGFVFGESAANTCKPQAKDFRDQASELAICNFKQFGKSTTALSMECLSFTQPTGDFPIFTVEVREVHNAACGGDAQTAPLAAILKVDVREGAPVLVEDRVTGKFNPLLKK